MKEYIEIKVMGHLPEIVEFLRLIRYIQSLGSYGMSRDIKVSVDGDGSGKLKFTFSDKDGKIMDMPNFLLEDMRQLDEAGGIEVDIGE